MTSTWLDDIDLVQKNCLIVTVPAFNRTVLFVNKLTESTRRLKLLLIINDASINESFHLNYIFKESCSNGNKST